MPQSIFHSNQKKNPFFRSPSLVNIREVSGTRRELGLWWQDLPKTREKKIKKLEKRLDKLQGKSKKKKSKITMIEQAKRLEKLQQQGKKLGSNVISIRKLTKEQPYNESAGVLLDSKRLEYQQHQRKIQEQSKRLKDITAKEERKEAFRKYAVYRGYEQLKDLQPQKLLTDRYSRKSLSTQKKIKTGIFGILSSLGVQGVKGQSQSDERGVGRPTGSVSGKYVLPDGTPTDVNTYKRFMSNYRRQQQMQIAMREQQQQQRLQSQIQQSQNQSMSMPQQEQQEQPFDDSHLQIFEEATSGSLYSPQLSDGEPMQQQRQTPMNYQPIRNVSPNLTEKNKHAILGRMKPKNMDNPFHLISTRRPNMDFSPFREGMSDVDRNPLKAKYPWTFKGTENLIKKKESPTTYVKDATIRTDGKISARNYT